MRMLFLAEEAKRFEDGLQEQKDFHYIQKKYVSERQPLTHASQGANSPVYVTLCSFHGSQSRALWPITTCGRPQTAIRYRSVTRANVRPESLPYSEVTPTISCIFIHELYLQHIELYTNSPQKRHRMNEKQNDLKEVIVHLRTPSGAPAGPRDLSGRQSGVLVAYLSGSYVHCVS